MSLNLNLKLNLTLLLCLQGMTGSAQPASIPCADTTLYCYDGGASNRRPVVFCPSAQVDTHEVPLAIRDINREFLQKRLGPEFIERVHLQKVVLIVRDSLDVRFTDRCDPHYRYVFEYRIVFPDSISYSFITLYDKNGKMLKKPAIPRIKKKSTGRVVTVCEAKPIAEQNRKHPGKVGLVSIRYSEKHNCFVWEMRMPEYHKGKKTYIPFVLIDIESGKIVGYHTQKASRKRWPAPVF